uniref:Uncharacterized protein n=1 Tax=Arundo donax TaxID=35708 RepID=A0A0A8YD57_ARUDO
MFQATPRSNFMAGYAYKTRNTLVRGNNSSLLNCQLTHL